MLAYIVRVANTPRLLLTWIFGSFTTGATAYSLAEHVPWGIGLWWGVVTMFTVGYGDQYPTSVTGTFVAVAFMASMWLLLGVISPASLAAKLIVDRDAFTHREQEELKTNVREIRAAVAQLLESKESAA